MVQCCSVKGCKSNSRKTPNIRFYIFPSEKNGTLRKQWLDTIRRQNADGSPWQPKYFHKICSRHFKDGRPTPQNPLPALNLGFDSDESPTPVSRRGRRRSASHTVTTTSDSEPGKESKESEDGSSKMETNTEDSNSSTPSQSQSVMTPKGTSPAKSSDKSPKKSPTAKSPSTSSGAGAASDVVPRSSGRKRKKRVLPDALSDEEILDEEPESFVIWRSRTTPAAPSSTPGGSGGTSDAGSELGTTSGGMRMRPRRMTSLTSSQPAEVEPEPLPPSKRKRLVVKDDDGEEEEKDAFCWACHKEGTNLACELCLRGFHLKCLDINQACPNWVCLECEVRFLAMQAKTMRAECVDTRSPAMSLLTIDQLCVILRFACSQMRIPGSEPFHHPVDPVTLPLYADFIANPVDFATLERNIRRRHYGSTEAFLADVRWLLHNSIVFNGSNHKLTVVARSIVRICKQEISDIEGCPDCYMNAWIKLDKNWFIKPCRMPHTLVWAKLKGYPFWPGKAIVEESGQTDIRFFGAHDRAWVPTSNVFLLSREPPVEMKHRRLGLEEAMDELNQHIQKLKDKFGSFKYAAPNVPYNPTATYSHVNRIPGELQMDIKKELGVPLKMEALSAKVETKSELKSEMKLEGDAREEVTEGVEIAPDVSVSGASSSYIGTPERVETPMEESEPEVKPAEPAAVAESLVVTPKKQHLTRRTVEEQYATSVDLSAVQKADSRGVFEISEEALGPDVTNLQRKKLASEQLPKPRAATDKSIVDRLEKKIQESLEDKDSPTSEAPSEQIGAAQSSSPKEASSSGVEAEKATSPKTPPKDLSEETDTATGKKSPTKPPVQREEGDLSPPVLLPEKDSYDKGDSLVEEGVEVNSLSGTPKKNPLLANLVESCKAKLGITSEGDLKGETSPSHETEEEEEEEAGTGTTGSSSSPQTPVSGESSTKGHEEDEEEEEEEEGEEEGEEEEDDEDEDEDEEDEVEEDEEGEKQEDGKVEEKEGEHASAKRIDETEDVEKKIEEGSTKSDSTVVEFGEETQSKEKTENEGDTSKPLGLEKSEPLEKKDETTSHSTPEKDSIEKQSEQSAKKESICVAQSETIDKTKDTEVEEPMDVDVKRSSDHEKTSNNDKNEVKDSDKNIEQIPPADSNVEKNKSISEKRDPSSEKSVDDLSSKLSPTKKMPEDKPFPTRLLEELVKPCTPKSDAGSSGVRSSESPASALLESAVLRGSGESSREATPAPVISSVQDSQSLQQPSGEGKSPVNKEPVQSHIEQNQEQKSPTVPVVKDKDSKVEDPVAVSQSEGEKVGSEVTPDVLESASVSSYDSEVVMGDLGIRPAKSRKLRTLKSLLKQDNVEMQDVGFNVDKYVNKAMEGVQSVFQEMFDDFISSDMGQKTAQHLKAELSRVRWHYDQALVEQQHNADLTLAETRLVLEHENSVRIKKLIRLHEEERERALEEVKKKQWCANCSKEAMFYCCWNTSYCDYPCQQKHWSKHMASCTQTTQSAPPPYDSTHTVLSTDTLTTPSYHGIAAKTTEQLSQRGTKRAHPESGTPQRSVSLGVPAGHGVQYIPTQTVTGAVSKVASNVSKTVKLAGGSSGMVQYLTSPLGGTTTTPVALQQLLTSQGTTSATGAPIMFVQQPQVPNIRIITTQAPAPASTQNTAKQTTANQAAPTL